MNKVLRRSAVKKLAKGSQLIPEDLSDTLMLDQGQVDVYALVGPHRVFLCELDRGALIVPPEPGDASIALVAREECVLHRVMMMEPMAPQDAVPALEAWIEAVSAGLSNLAPGRPSLTPMKADSVTVSVANTALTAAHGTVWVTPGLISGARFMGASPAEGTHPVPVTHASWMALGGDQSVEAKSSAALFARSRKGTSWLAIPEAFTGLVLQTVAAFMAARDEDAQARIAKREEQVSATLQTGMERFEQLLTVESAIPPQSDDNAFIYQVIAREAPDAAIQKRGITDVARFFALHHARTRKVGLTEGWWRRDIGPMIVTRAHDGRCGAIRRNAMGRPILYMRGERPRVVGRWKAKLLEPQALVVILALPNATMKARQLLSIGLGMSRADLMLLVIASLGAAGLGSLLPLATGLLINTYIPAGAAGPLVLIGIGLAVAQLAQSALGAASGILRLRMDGRIAERLGGGMMDRMMRLPTSVTKPMSGPDLALRLSAVDGIRRSMMNVLLDLIIYGSAGLAGVALLIWYSPLAGAVAIGMAVAAVGVGIFTAFRQERAIYEGEKMEANVITFTQELVSNIATLRAYGAEKRAFARWALSSAEMRARSMKMRRVGNVFEGFLAGFQIVAIGVVFAILGGTLSVGDGLTTGSYVVFVTTFQSFLSAAVLLARSGNQLLLNRPQIKRAKPLLENAPETPPQAKDPGSLSGAVEVSNLTYSFGERRLLRGISFRITPGSFLVLVGPSGSGKSTLLNLLVGFQKPSGGAVLFDDKNINGLDLAGLRQQIGFVRQDGKLFAGSILENIQGVHEGDEDAVWRPPSWRAWPTILPRCRWVWKR